MRRGELVTIVMTSDFGKPHPALVIQSDAFDHTGTFTLLLLSATLADARLIRPTVSPKIENSLRAPSQAMVDKVMSVRRAKIGPTIGPLNDKTMFTNRRGRDADRRADPLMLLTPTGSTCGDYICGDDGPG